MTPLGPLHVYFDGERNAGLFVAVLGVAAIAFAAWLWRDGGSFRAMLYPMALVGLIQVAIGVGLSVKTPGQVAALERGLTERAEAAHAEEKARMVRVNRNWIVIEVVEVAVIAAALVMVFLLRSRPGFAGVGMGLLVQASIMLVFDLFAEERARVYTAWLETFIC